MVSIISWNTFWNTCSGPNVAALFAKKNNNINWGENFHVAANKIAPVNDDNKNPVRDNPDIYNILFIGLLGYYPNYIGLHHFITSIWMPVYQQLNSKVCLRIVGAGLPSEYQIAWSAVPGVDIRGFVHDLSEVYENIDLSIVPIYQGSGTHIKIPEALIRGIPLVITPLAHRGFEETLKDAECFQVAQDDHSFVDKIVGLIGNKELRISQAREGRAKVTQHYVFVPGDIGLEHIMPCT